MTYENMNTVMKAGVLKLENYLETNATHTQ